MRKMEEVIILDDIGILDEKLNLGGFSASLRSLGYLMFGGLFAYALIKTGRAPEQALGIIILLAAAVVGFYPSGAARVESTIIAMLHYYLYRRRKSGKAADTKPRGDTWKKPERGAHGEPVEKKGQGREAKPGKTQQPVGG